jgi:hypothetical protein
VKNKRIREICGLKQIEKDWKEVNKLKRFQHFDTANEYRFKKIIYSEERQVLMKQDTINDVKSGKKLG